MTPYPGEQDQPWRPPLPEGTPVDPNPPLAPYQQPPAPAWGTQPYAPPPYGQPPYGQPSYGQQQPYPMPPGYPEPMPYSLRPATSNGLAVAAMVCGIVALVLSWVPGLSWVLALLAIIFGAIGISRANRGAPQKGLAVTGLVLGIVSIALYLLLFVLLLSVV